MEKERQRQRERGGEKERGKEKEMKKEGVASILIKGQKILILNKLYIINDLKKAFIQKFLKLS